MYTYPNVAINHVTYTALRWGQFPTIAYTTGGTAGSEVVTIADDLSAISIKISSGVSTNAQISAAIAASTATVRSLMAKDLISVAIAGGHTTDTNTAVSATPLTGAVNFPPPSALSEIIDDLNITQADSDGHSHQTVSADLTLTAQAGSNASDNPKYKAAAMWNVFGDSLVRIANYIGGVIGAYSVTGTKATTYPSGAVLAQISDGVTDVDGAVVAYIDGDGDQTNAGAAFKVMNNNSVPGSGFAYGLDLSGATHDGYPAVAYTVAEMRFSNGTKVTVSGDTIVFTNAAGNKSATITMS